MAHHVLSTQERLARYLKARPLQRIPKGLLCDLAREKLGVTGETVGRRLRVLREAGGMHPASAPTPEHEEAIRLLEGGSIEVEHRDRNHCFYYYVPPTTRQVRRVEVVDGVAREVYETVTI